MTTRFGRWMRTLETKRLVALGMAPGLAALGLDAAISHFAGREMAHPAQLLPVVFGPLGGAALAAVAVSRRGPMALVRGLRAVGGAMVLLGTVGTGFHLRALLRLLAGERLSWPGLQTALAVAPPLMAPGAFAALGAMIVLLAAPRLELRLIGPDSRPAASTERLARAA